MRLGAVFPQGELGSLRPADVRSFVQQLEAAGYDHLLAFDHVLGADSRVRPGWSGAYDHRDQFLEPFVLFGFLAGFCDLGFVTDVLVLPQRQTALVAKQAATLEALAPGRLRLGVGIGWNDVEYEALGVDFHDRTARMEEQIPLLRRLWTEETLRHEGAHHRILDAGIAPRPAASVPIWIGCGTDVRALDRVARLADGWIPAPQIQPRHGFEECWERIRRTAAAAGVDGPQGFEGHARVVPGDEGQIVERVERWRAAGADAVAINPLRCGAEWPHGHLDSLLRAARLLVEHGS